MNRSAFSIATRPTFRRLRAVGIETVCLLSICQVASGDPNAPTEVVSDWLSDTVSSTDSQPASGASQTLLVRRPKETIKRSESGRPSGAGGSSHDSLMWATAVVLALIGVAAIAAKRWFMPLHRGPNGGPIRVLARHALSPKQSLCLVRVGSGVILVGVTPDRIQTLTEIRDPEAAGALVADAERGRSGSFTQAFNRFIDTERGSEPPEASAAESATGRTAQSMPSSVRQLLTRVRAMSQSMDAAEAK